MLRTSRHAPPPIRWRGSAVIDRTEETALAKHRPAGRRRRETPAPQPYSGAPGEPYPDVPARHRSARGPAGRHPYRRPEDHDRYPFEPADGYSGHSDTASIGAPANTWPTADMTQAIPQRRSAHDAAGIVPSTTEVAVYTLLGAAVASAVFVVGGRPYWHVALVAVAALIIILLSAITSRRTPGSERPSDAPGEPQASTTPTPTGTARRGRRRRKKRGRQ